MNTHSLLWRIFPWYLLVLVAAGAAILFTSTSDAHDIHSIMIIGICAAAAMMMVSFFVVRYVRNRFAEIEAAATRLGAGENGVKVVLPETAEFRSLARTFNSMATQVARRVTDLTVQRNELKAVLSSMVEGVLVIDAQEKIVSLNNSAALMFGLDVNKAQGQPIQATIWNSDFQQMTAKILSGISPIEQEIMIYSEPRRYLQAHGALFKRAGSSGAVIVCNDITRLKQLEDLRRQFVANVSHELKTPITSIKGFVETLLESNETDPEQARRFLEIIAKQSNRLNAILDDLLSLSKIEQGTESMQIVKTSTSIKEVFTAAVGACQSKIADKKAKVRIECDEMLSAPVNSELLEQAVINLIDNAVKYSEAGRQIIVAALPEDDHVAITVTDQGYGIAQEHLARIFERFYVADKARTRKLGGTGLGLAIVKHIAAAHGGSVSVQSEPGKGSTFTIMLPKSK